MVSLHGSIMLKLTATSYQSKTLVPSMGYLARYNVLGHCVKTVLVFIQMLTSLPPYLVAIQTWHCNAYSKNLLFQFCINIALHLFSDLSIKSANSCTIGLGFYNQVKGSGSVKKRGDLLLRRSLERYYGKPPKTQNQTNTKVEVSQGF